MLSIVEIPIRWGVWLTATVLIAVALYHLGSRKARGMFVYVCVFIIIISTTSFVYCGDRLGMVVRFHTLADKYGEIIDAVQAKVSAPPDVRYIVDQERPLRVVFQWPGGIGDNWCAIVYDESDDLARCSTGANGFIKKSGRLSGSRIFVDLCYIDEIGKHWYFCCFT
jgi:hypothetical protein